MNSKDTIMSHSNTLVTPTEVDLQVEETTGDLELGAWYWVTSTAQFDDNDAGLKAGDKYVWFGCAVEIGSNYVEIRSPHGRHSRIHLDSYWSRLRKEHDPKSVIQAEVDKHMAESERLSREMHALVARLGVSPRPMLDGSNPSSSGSALVAMSSQPDPSGYRNALIAAKDKDLPALKKALEHSHEMLTIWLKASMLPLTARIIDQKATIEEIDDRLFSLTLYAGLSEQAVQCSAGEPAGFDEPLHVMQRRLYADEECLLNYQAGGMTFDGIGEFDTWVAQPENRDRILPFPRCLVAMRVRRNGKERDVIGGDLLSEFVAINNAEADKITYLYVRNGEQVWRLTTETDFGSMIFPDTAIYRQDEELMFHWYFQRVEKIVPKAMYDQVLALHTERRRNCEAWQAANPSQSWFDNPYRNASREERIEGTSFDFSPSNWHPFNPSSVYYDEALAAVEKQVKEFNRIAVIIQGLFDRSEILHPHPPVQSWVPESFARSVRLVYDASYALHDGEKPDFEAYRAELNASLGVGSVVVGQEDFWLRREADKENTKRDNNWRCESSARYVRFRPYGNPGPGRVRTIEEWKPRGRQAVFRWEREPARSHRDPAIPVSLAVPAGALFNISAYTQGDYKRFFSDPRTRAEYIKWAPLLLTAEDWLAGKVRDRGNEYVDAIRTGRE